MKKKTTILVLTLFIIIVLTIGVQQKEFPASPNYWKDVPLGEKDFFEKNSDKTIENDKGTPSVENFTEELAHAVQQIPQAFLEDELQIVAIGDSLTQGVGDPSDQGGYVGILDNYLNQNQHIATFENLGKRGSQTSHLIDRMKQPEIIDSIKGADMILITIGANDIMQVLKENFMEITYEVFATERLHYEKRLRTIMTTLNELNPDVPVYLIGFYNPFQQYFEHIKELDMIVTDWNNTSEKVAKDFEAVFIPTEDLFLDSKVNLFASDHFHPNGLGYQRMAARILNYLVQD
ncbi:SGNH/GDSL hydrolase family protein [Ornithinibacillus scapharcae]|uniref:SGNH/GDSL hydrolase family protein n=1 Tax=Ornithinibacillus scapharcae TaxID=1147159 RepID=UPI000225AE48|nr:SGNH/GDSL hydrolase family protein [Ornithinibacillus scapharcae]